MGIRGDRFVYSLGINVVCLMIAIKVFTDQCYSSCGFILFAFIVICLTISLEIFYTKFSLDIFR